MKKSLILLLSALVIAVAFVSCGSDSDDKPKDPVVTVVKPAAVTEVAATGGTIDVEFTITNRTIASCSFDVKFAEQAGGGVKVITEIDVPKKTISGTDGTYNAQITVQPNARAGKYKLTVYYKVEGEESERTHSHEFTVNVPSN